MTARRSDDDPIDRTGLGRRFWEKKSLDRMNRDEWEALCDGCGKCCLNKLEDFETGEVALTRLACRLFDDSTCRCSQYPIRHNFVPECIVLSPETIEQHAYWLPRTCAYRLLHVGEPLPKWHPLLTGTAQSVHDAGISLQDRTIPEFDVDEDDWEDFIIEEPV
ncbi:YcgN family cysteine cluster protein [Chachezhania antarctica]|uniref:YcgN family cysteine cluster protein n=1 Tax=Chachezhania antarctica TaxID=2340860 RepID=UPI000EAC5E24|nr:YcgN family cysteine cluster protein [Chachezhania antarctica]|tara:strand:+ start:5158 stop:5646 length:489 start_codon:yes stop_codon:yes gene_type:complete